MEIVNEISILGDNYKNMNLDALKIGYLIMNNQFDEICPLYHTCNDDNNEENNEEKEIKTTKTRKRYKPFNYDAGMYRLYLNESPNCSEIFVSLMNNLISLNYNPESKENYVRLLSMLLYVLKDPELHLKNKDKKDKNRIVESTLEMYSKYIDKMFLNDDLIINYNLKVLIECMIKVDLKHLNHFINKIKLMDYLTKFNESNRYYNIFDVYYFYFNKLFSFDNDMGNKQNIFRRYIENKNQKEEKKGDEENSNKENKDDEKEDDEDMKEKENEDLFYLNTKLKFVLIIMIYLKGIQFSDANFNLSNNLIKIIGKYIKAEKNHDSKLFLLYMLILISIKNKNNSLVDIITGGLVSVFNKDNTKEKEEQDRERKEEKEDLEENNKESKENKEYLCNIQDLVNRVFVKYFDLLCKCNVDGEKERDKDNKDKETMNTEENRYNNNKNKVDKIINRLNKFDMKLIYNNKERIHEMNKKVYIVYINKLVINNNSLDVKLKLINDYVRRLSKVPLNINRQVIENLLDGRSKNIEIYRLTFELIRLLVMEVEDSDRYGVNTTYTYKRMFMLIEKINKEDKEEEEKDRGKVELNKEKEKQRDEEMKEENKRNEKEKKDDMKEKMEIYSNYLNLMAYMKGLYKVKGAFNSLKLLKDPFISYNAESSDNNSDGYNVDRMKLDYELMKVMNSYNVGNGILVNKHQQNVFSIITNRYLSICNYNKNKENKEKDKEDNKNNTDNKDKDKEDNKKQNKQEKQRNEENKDNKDKYMRKYIDELKKYMRSILRNIINEADEEELDVYMRGYDMRSVYNLVVNNNLSLLYGVEVSNKDKEKDKDSNEKEKQREEEDKENKENEEENNLEMAKCVNCIVGGNFIGNPVLLALLNVMLIIEEKRKEDLEDNSDKEKQRDEEQKEEKDKEVNPYLSKKEVKCRSCSRYYLNYLRLMSSGGSNKVDIGGFRVYVLGVMGYYLDRYNKENSKEQDNKEKNLMKQLKQIMNHLSLDMKNVTKYYKDNKENKEDDEKDRGKVELNKEKLDNLESILERLGLFRECDSEECDLLECPVFVLNKLLSMLYKYVLEDKNRDDNEKEEKNNKENNKNSDNKENNKRNEDDKYMNVRKILFSDNFMEVCDMVLRGEYYYMGDNVESEMYLTVVKILYYLFSRFFEYMYKYNNKNKDNKEDREKEEDDEKEQGDNKKDNKEKEEKRKLNKYYQLLYTCYKCTNNVDDVLIKETMYKIIIMIVFKKDKNKDNKENNKENKEIDGNEFYLRLMAKGYKLNVKRDAVYKYHTQLNNQENNKENNKNNTDNKDKDNKEKRKRKLRWDKYNKYMVFKKCKCDSFMESIDVDNVILNYNQCVFLNNNNELVLRLSGLSGNNNKNKDNNKEKEGKEVEDKEETEYMYFEDDGDEEKVDSRMRLLLYNYYIPDMEFVMRYMYKLVLIRYYRYVVNNKNKENKKENNNKENHKESNKGKVEYDKIVLLVLYYLIKDNEWDRDFVLRMVDMLLVLDKDNEEKEKESNKEEKNGDNNNKENNKRKLEEVDNKEDDDEEEWDDKNNMKYILQYVKMNINSLDKQLVVKFIMYLLDEIDENKEEINKNNRNKNKETKKNKKQKERHRINKVSSDRMKELLLKYNVGCSNVRELNTLYNWASRLLINELVVGGSGGTFLENHQKVGSMTYLFKNGGYGLFYPNYMNSDFNNVSDKGFVRYFVNNML